MNNKSLATRLKELRLSRNLKQQDVADMLGLTQSAYAFYEQGKREPTTLTLQKLAQIYNVSTDYLLGLTDNPNSGLKSPDDSLSLPIPQESEDAVGSSQQFSFNLSAQLLSQRLIHLRKERGFTQRQLADLIRISPSTYNQYEVGRLKPNYDVLMNLANLYNVSIDYILGRTDDPTPPKTGRSSFETRNESQHPKDSRQQMIEEAIEQLDPEEQRIIRKIRSSPDVNLQFKDFDSDPVESLRDLVKVWRLLHPEDFENGNSK